MNWPGLCRQNRPHHVRNREPDWQSAVATSDERLRRRDPHLRSSGGPGHAVELRLPEEITVSRVHAEFIFAEGQWWIISKGLNGLVLNGTALAGEQMVQPGDVIHWGARKARWCPGWKSAQKQDHRRRDNARNHCCSATGLR